MKFYDKYTNRRPSEAVKDAGKSLVETAGYIPAKNQIENLINAGINLRNFREAHYDFEGEKIDDNYYDPTREPNFDLADASTLLSQTTDKLADQEAKAKQEEKDKKEAVKKAKLKAEIIAEKEAIAQTELKEN